MYSQVSLMGRLGQEPQLTYVKGDVAVCSFSVAVQPTKDSPTDWWKVTTWREQAEFAANHLTKGGRVMIVGDPRLDEWDDEKGHHARLAVTARTLKVIDWADDPEEVDGKGEAGSQQEASAAEEAAVRKGYSRKASGRVQAR